MGILHNDLKERNDVYDELIKHFKTKIIDDNKNSNKNEYIMQTYDYEVKKADRGDAYFFENLMAHGFGGLSLGLGVGCAVLDNPALLLGALASAGISAYNYIRFKKLSLSRGLGTRMLYAEQLQNILEENNFKYPFNSGTLEDYQSVEDYVELLREY